MKWTLRKSGFQQGGGGIGGGGGRRGWEAGIWKWGIASSRNPPPPYYLHSLHPHLRWESMLVKGRVTLSPVRINIIYVINIKITLLCFVSGSKPRQLEGLVPTDGCFRPCFLSAPPSLAIYRDHNLLWWVFRVLFCQGQSGLSNKWSQQSGAGLAQPPSTFLFCKWHTWQNSYFESFASIASVLDTGLNRKKRRGWQRCKEQK